MVGRASHHNRHPRAVASPLVRVLLVVSLLSLSLAGCLVKDDGDGVDVPPSPLSLYRFQYAGSDVAVDGVDHGWLIRVTNDGDTVQSVNLLTSGIASGLIGGISETGGTDPQTAWLPGRIENGQVGAPITLDPGESGLFLARIQSYDGDGEVPVTVRAVSLDPEAFDPVATSTSISWTVAVQSAATPATPGDHVQTVTVGVWLNGTSFYSNAADALADPDFPHADGWTSPDDPTDPLPIYVYGVDRDEQPLGSQDTCHFTTISGYNALLKTQSEGSTNVALLRPEAAYTVEGAEDHPLYGDSLVFLNTVVAHDGSTGTMDELPNPTGACFMDRVDNAVATVTGLLPVPLR